MTFASAPAICCIEYEAPAVGAAGKDTAEAGYIFGRQRRWGQIWGGIRFLVPVATTNRIGTSLPDLPWGLLSVRFLL